MDIIKLDRTTYMDGEIVNGLTSKLWVERYSTNGEFKFTCSPQQQFMDLLPIGSLITHAETLDVMMVEDYEIDETKVADKNDILIITGRSVDQIIFEDRIVTDDHRDGNPWTGTDSDGFTEEELVYTAWPAPGNTKDQIAQLIYDYLVAGIEGTGEELPNFSTYTLIFDDEVPQVERTLKKFDTLANSISEMLASIDCGIKVTRPPFIHPTQLQFVVHHGYDKTASVQFDWEMGDIERAKYFWTRRGAKNAAYILGDACAYKYRSDPLAPPKTGFDLRIATVDASDYKPPFSRPLNPLAAYAVGVVLKSRGIDAIATMNEKTILEASVSPTTRYQFKTDYDIGDKVFVRGNYGVNAIMRVTEYARTEDKEGESGFPTLSLI